MKSDGSFDSTSVHARHAVLVVTEGILTARLQSDPLLSEFRLSS